MDKYAMAAILKQASVALKSLTQERETLLSKMAELMMKVATLEQQSRMTKVAEALGTRGAYSGTPFQERLELVQEKLASGVKLEDLERAVDLMSPDGSLGSLGTLKTAGSKELEKVLRQITLS